ncbi:ABC transporter substrate-binding protein [Candidatus Nitrosotenuis chungbukensis]|uniref:ABC transporter substrate-binding protein n=1 Tax=Candidatus Nitrosotenuis chungbukensis TaxID=1353246 RepID=UPI0005B284BD|nr:ABC transporter substrate-binding protein [Candidatus Nitrosotenuis chungbukensis]WKT57287.1 ABC transporter substrate-binding protein [Candidatus Nitrosotenuis chungbukensis]
MKVLLVLFLAFSFGVIYAEKGTHINEIQFVQYLDESNALEEVKNGNLDMYYSRIPSELLETPESRQNLDVFYVTGGSYSILANPAEGDKINPFSSREVRFALNYLVDRRLVVDELMGGYGIPMASSYGPYDPDYLSILSEMEKFHFRYNPEHANDVITKVLAEKGAQKTEGKWYYDGKPIEIIIFIRNDDPVRKSIGEILSSEMEKIGFVVRKDFGDLNKAYVTVYGSNPSDLKWNLYTEGWAGRSAFVKYDSLGPAQMYAPWFSNMPGFNNPSYWNYKNPHLDYVTQKIYSGNFTSVVERENLIRDAVSEGVTESVRVFLASKIDPFVTNKRVSGVINDFGGGITNRLTPINARSSDDNLKIGVKQIYQGAWNPIGGLADAYSKNIWDLLYDPGIFKNPYSGENFSVRENWKVETAGPHGHLDVPRDAVIWDPVLQKWANVGLGVNATSKVTFDLTFGNWHSGQEMDMNDVLYSMYFSSEWGSPQTENDKTFDSSYSPQASQSQKTLVGMRPIDNHTVEVYVNYWHFDESEIAGWASVWPTVPWEVIAAMEKIVLDGKASFSRTDAQAKNLNWLSLIVPRDASLVRETLGEFQRTKHVPAALLSFDNDAKYYDSRYESAIKWIDLKNHAVISNGPFYLESYSPEARAMTVRSFDDPSYPFKAGYWEKFEKVNLPKIIQVDIPSQIVLGQPLEIPIRTSDATQIYYFVSTGAGDEVDIGILDVNQDAAKITLSAERTQKMIPGGNDLKLYAISDLVLKPDIYTTSVFATSVDYQNYTETITQNSSKTENTGNLGLVSAILGIMMICVVAYVRKSKTRLQRQR